MAIDTVFDFGDCQQLGNAAALGLANINALWTLLNAKQVLPVVDLRAEPYLLTPNDTSKASSNRAAMATAISEHSTGAILMLGPGDYYFDRTPATQYSILFPAGTSRVVVAGQGPHVTRLIQHGDSSGADWHLVIFEATTSCGLSNLGLLQGTITNPEAGQHQHLWQVRSQTVGVDNVDTFGRDLWFGKALGDAVSLLGGQASDSFGVVRGFSLDRFVMRMDGNVDGVRIGARTGISFQRGYSNVRISNGDIYGHQNSAIDMESTAGSTTTMEWAHFENIRVDQTFSNSTVAVSFTGISNGQKTEHLRATDISILNGRLQVASTSDAVIEDVSLHTSSVFGNGSAAQGGANCYVIQVNDDLVFRNLSITRGTAVAAGECLSVNSTGNRVMIDGGVFMQGTNQHAIRVEDSDKVLVIGTPRIIHSGAAPTNFSALFVGAITRNASQPTIHGLAVDYTGAGSLRAAVSLVASGTLTMTLPEARDVSAKGTVVNGVYLSVAVGATMGVPIVAGIDNGSGTAWKQVDGNDNAITTIHPIISGNRSAICMHSGEATPEAAVTAVQGCMHVHRNGDSTVIRFKTSTTGNTGWTTLTIN